MALLEVDGVGRRFGGVQAVADVTFALQPGEVFGVIGPNGAGKTTLFNLIAGLFEPSSGRVVLDGTDITGWPSDSVARLGIGRTFQGVHTFKGVTVRENLQRAALLAHSFDPLRHFGNLMRRRSSVDVAVCEDVARFVGLHDRLEETAAGLSYGLKKLLGIGMALMQQPRLLLMDEPAAGLNPTEKRRLGEVIRDIRQMRCIDVMLVEHDMKLIMETCDRILVMNQGRPIALGDPTQVRSDPAVIDAYLGVDYDFA
jgi:branched-chain amino acid transport system ATP-binding protein